MSTLRHPDACDVCSGKLTGAAEISLEREADQYFINVSQKSSLDWGICPKCKRVACLASCWNKQMSQCKACASANDAESCPECHRLLVGAVEVVETEMFGIPTVLLEETADRNWIQCDSCSLVICKQCCRNPQSGFCNRCLARNCPVVEAEQNAKEKGALASRIIPGHFTLLDVLTGEATDLFRNYGRQNGTRRSEPLGQTDKELNNNQGGEIK